MTIDLNADLHCHSVVSDGTLTPEALAARAKANGVGLWALTDHDEIGGQHRAIAAAHAQGMDYLTGVEISVTFADTTVHIVGLGFDPDDGRLAQGLAASRGSDFHSPDESHTDLGTLPPLPGQLTPVWELLANRILRPAHA